jgi:acyl-CoA thioester hydrolase
MTEPPASGDAHVLPVRVYWEDTDGSGIVYHASYLRFAERARTEMLRDLGIHQSGLLAETGVAFVVRRCRIDYRAPARLDDLLDVVTRIVDVRGASLGMVQRVERAGQTLTELELVLACIDRNGRATRVPAPVRAAFEKTARSAPGGSDWD